MLKINCNKCKKKFVAAVAFLLIYIDKQGSMNNFHLLCGICCQGMANQMAEDGRVCQAVKNRQYAAQKNKILTMGQQQSYKG